jgi:hypothetical protein
VARTDGGREKETDGRSVLGVSQLGVVAGAAPGKWVLCVCLNAGKNILPPPVFACQTGGGWETLVRNGPDTYTQ